MTALMGNDWSFFVLTNTSMSLALAVSGVLLTRQRPRNPIGWLLFGGALAHAVSALSWPLHYATGQHAWELWVTLLLPLALLVFPTGRLPGPWWQVLVWVLVLTAPPFVIGWPMAQVVW